MCGEGTAAQDVPVRQIQLQKSMMDGCCSFRMRETSEENETRTYDSDEERSAGRVGES